MSEFGKINCEKKNHTKNEKKTENQCQNSACEQKTTSQKANFFQMPFSHSLKIRAKKFHATKTLAFLLHFLFGRDQNQYSNINTPDIAVLLLIIKKLGLITTF